MSPQPKIHQEPETHLLKPTGPHRGSHVDALVVNPALSPDPLCTADGGDPACDSHKQDFDASNPERCHAMSVRVSYPADGGTQLGDVYFPPTLRQYRNFLKAQQQAGIPGLSDEMIESILKERSYSTENLPIRSGKFPVVFLAPGHREPSQSYEDVRSELVSRGYIVVGIGSTFINPVALPDQSDYQHVVWPAKVSNPGVLFRPQQQDILWVLKNLSKLPMYSSMDLTRVGFLGHSLGASVLADLLHSNPSLAQAFASLETCRPLDEPADTALTISNKDAVLYMVAGNRENDPASFPVSTANQTLVRVAPSPMRFWDPFTSHESYTVLETMQDHPGFKVVRQYYAQQGKPNVFDTGTGDGQTVAHATSIYVGEFFDRSLLGIPSRELQSCIPLFPNVTTICCGPGVCNTTVVDQMAMNPRARPLFTPQTMFAMPEQSHAPRMQVVSPKSAPTVFPASMASSTTMLAQHAPVPLETIFGNAASSAALANPPLASDASRLEPPAPISWVAAGWRAVGGLFSRSPTNSASGSVVPSDSKMLVCGEIQQDGVTMQNCIFVDSDSSRVRSAEPVEPGVLSTLGTAAARGAIYAAFPEAVGDTLRLSGVVGERNAERVKLVTNFVMTIATGSHLAAGASYFTTALLRYAGCSDATARVTGNAAGFLVSTGARITPLGIASTALNYVGGRFGLWAERRVVGALEQHRLGETACAATHHLKIEELPDLSTATASHRR